MTLVAAFLQTTATMETLRVFLFMLRILPAIPHEDMTLRWGIASACVSATSDQTERYVCAKIARFESQYREDVARCEKKGSAGEVTAWQILPRSPEDRDRLCRSLDEDAVVAIERVRESRRACRHLPTAEQLAIYTRGSCTSVEGRRLSRVRWPYHGEVE